jgi:hypothetical protein
MSKITVGPEDAVDNQSDYEHQPSSEDHLFAEESTICSGGDLEGALCTSEVHAMTGGFFYLRLDNQFPKRQTQTIASTGTAASHIER